MVDIRMRDDEHVDALDAAAGQERQYHAVAHVAPAEKRRACIEHDDMFLRLNDYGHALPDIEYRDIGTASAGAAGSVQRQRQCRQPCDVASRPPGRRHNPYQWQEQVQPGTPLYCRGRQISIRQQQRFTDQPFEQFDTRRRCMQCSIAERSQWTN